MPKKSLADQLREETERAIQAREAKNRAEIEAINKASDENTKRRIAEIIQSLPEKMMAAAKDGKNVIEVLNSHMMLCYRVAKKALCKYAQKNGLVVSTKEYGDDESPQRYETLYFSWDKK